MMMMIHEQKCWLENIEEENYAYSEMKYTSGIRGADCQ